MSEATDLIKKITGIESNVRYTHMAIVKDKYIDEVMNSCKEQDIPFMRNRSGDYSVIHIRQEDIKPFRDILQDIYSKEPDYYKNFKPHDMVDIAKGAGSKKTVRLDCEDKGSAEQTSLDLFRYGVRSAPAGKYVYIFENDLYRPEGNDFITYTCRKAMLNALKETSINTEEGPVSLSKIGNLEASQNRYDRDTLERFSSYIKDNRQGYVLASYTSDTEKTSEPYLEFYNGKCCLHKNGKERELPVTNKNMGLEDINRFISDAASVIKCPAIIRKRDHDRLLKGDKDKEIEEHIRQDNVNNGIRDDWNFKGLSPRECQAVLNVDKYIVPAIEQYIKNIHDDHEEDKTMSAYDNYQMQRTYMEEKMDSVRNELQDSSSQSYKDLVQVPVSLWDRDNNTPVGATAIAEVVTEVTRNVNKSFTSDSTIENVDINESLIEEIKEEETRIAMEEFEKAEQSAVEEEEEEENERLTDTQ